MRTTTLMGGPLDGLTFQVAIAGSSGMDDERYGLVPGTDYAKMRFGLRTPTDDGRKLVATYVSDQPRLLAPEKLYYWRTEIQE